MTLVRRYYRSWSPSDIYDACRLCLVTSDEWLDGRTLQSCVAEAIVGGVSLVQLRMKKARPVDVATIARNVIPVCRIANVPFVVYNDIEAAKVAGADGVHIYDNSISCDEVREELGHDAIIGFSVSNVDDAVAAEAQGASYLEVGPVFGSRDDKSIPLVGVDVVKEISDTVEIPVLAIGGVNSSNISDLADADVAGVSCISAILAAPDIEQAAASLSKEVNAYIRSSVVI